MTSCIPLDYFPHSKLISTDETINTTNEISTYAYPYIQQTVPINVSNNQTLREGFLTDGLQQQELFENIENIVYQFITPSIGVFGALGNVLNLIVLTRKTVTMTMNRMEKSSHTGLTALALSDLLFCLMIIPHSWAPTKQFIFTNLGFNIIYSLYSEALINIFIMSSTWLTVIIAISRYLAIVHPIKARDITGMTFTVTCIIITFLICFLSNLPRFWNETIGVMQCKGNFEVYYREMSYFKNNSTIRMYYSVFYFLFVIFIPFLVLIYCNIFLIKALKQSIEMREQYQPSSKKVKDSAHRITLTLIIIIIMYILLVIPGEIIQFIRIIAREQSSSVIYYNLIVSLLNLFQAFNFSFNFVLYCIVNVHFRKTVLMIFCSRFAHERAQIKSSDSTTLNSRSVTSTTAI